MSGQFIVLPVSRSLQKKILQITRYSLYDRFYEFMTE